MKMKYVTLSTAEKDPDVALHELEKKVAELLHKEYAIFSKRKHAARYPGNIEICDIKPDTGWEPLGGHQLTYDSTQMVWHASQAMINKGEKD